MKSLHFPEHDLKPSDVFRQKSHALLKINYGTTESDIINIMGPHSPGREKRE